MKRSSLFILSFCLIISPLCFCRVNPNKEVRQQKEDALQYTADEISKFLEEELTLEYYIFPPGKLPEAKWKNAERVSLFTGSNKPAVTFYDCRMRTVTKAVKPGRYGAEVKCLLKNGFELKKYFTLYCTGGKINSLEKKDVIPYLKKRGIKERILKSDYIHINDLLNELDTLQAAKSPQAAIFLASINESPKDNPLYIDRDWWVKFKLKETNSINKLRVLQPPQKTAGKSVVLKKEVGKKNYYANSQTENIANISNEWFEKDKVPFVTLVAYKGQVVFSKATGRFSDGEEAAINTPMWLASISKMLTGCIMMEFADQGLIDLDASVEKYLPELKKAGRSNLTIRHLFTHTNGFSKFGEWGSDWNNNLENNMALYIPAVKIGEKFEYNRLGYALAGKVMERLSGKSMPRLFEEYLFKPMGIKNFYIENTYGGAFATAYDIACIGQMLLNKGSYNGRRFFSEKSFAKMLPVKLDKLVPNSTKEWGIGTTWLGGNGLSAKTFAHEAASGSVLRIDPENDLIIVIARNSTGNKYSDYKKYSDLLINALAAPFIKK